MICCNIFPHKSGEAGTRSSKYFSPIVYIYIDHATCIWLKEEVPQTGCFLCEIGYQP